MFRSIFRPTGAGRQVRQIAPDQAFSRQNAGALIVDVRETGEWREGHIPGALHIPLRQIGKLPSRITHDQEVIVVCRSGNRSGAAAQALAQAGYTNVSNLAGGMIAWQRQGLKISR